MKLIRLIYLCIRLRSFSRARWVAAFENFQPTHGK